MDNLPSYFKASLSLTPLDTMLHYHTAWHLSNMLIWSRVPSVTNRH